MATSEPNIMFELLKYNADPNLLDKKDNSALVYATWNRNYSSILLLLQSDSKVTDKIIQIAKKINQDNINEILSQTISKK